MKKDKKEKKNSGDTLKCIKPITPVAIINIIHPRFAGNDYAVNGMKQKREKNSENFDKQQVRDIMNILYVFIKNFASPHSRRICVHMHEEKCPERHNAG